MNLGKIRLFRCSIKHQMIDLLLQLLFQFLASAQKSSQAAVKTNFTKFY